ncbi:zinc-binding metallopeptidase family protein [Porticoccus hydrocarbonoclasticus]|uniref:zinc-binding metallopeptidase family protein n=1 Tax=Porticoccus hydrocarbonoclasticus TaxID=1073414 RepID=UPI00056C90B9|nr:putative zinc-binding metallopeptidase [Porticoccus hydrocarbonoclasticus]|tara:strand:+ start:1231 stop:2274 length:1044 start_codon:yes stop_codon:yes gene_type:complete
MKKFFCHCGNQVFFESRQCLYCKTNLGFDPGNMEMRTLTAVHGQLFEASDQQLFRFCSNEMEFGVCNWLLPKESNDSLCTACQFNRTVPNQSQPENRARWLRLEQGKKRLFFTLIQLGLPFENGWAEPERGLLLDFIEDGRTQPLFAETFVTTGYLGGVITINVMEADDIARVTVKSELKESYRTVLGHLRHESGHYYWSRLNPDDDMKRAFRNVFGDERQDYRSALDDYYRHGPAPDWADHFISSYASAHPSEDWAESWGHYLHIYDALETAAAHGVINHGPSAMDMQTRIDIWRQLSITLNELNRSVGRQDAYPFIINHQVENKLVFVDRVISQLQTLGSTMAIH